MVERRDVVVVGAGVIGLSVAHALHRRGITATVLETDGIGVGTSAGNAGHIVPSHVVPFAAPGMVASAVRDVLGRHGAFGISPTAGTSLITWSRRFVSACTHDNVAHAAPILASLNDLSIRTVDAWFPGLARRTGMMTVQRTSDGHRRAVAEAELLRGFGVRSVVLEGEAARASEPGLIGPLAGGVLYPDDAWLDPRELLLALAGPLGDVRTGVGVRGLDVAADGARLDTDRGTILADRVVIAAGAWTPRLVRRWCRLPLAAARGYSATLRLPAPPIGHALLLGEPHVAVTPMEPGLRITGRYEIAGRDRRTRPAMTRRLVAAASSYLALPDDPQVTWEWTGLRPSSPDGLPLIGPLSAEPRLVIATGHGMLGSTQAAGTGEVVAATLTSGHVPFDLAALAPERPMTGRARGSARRPGVRSGPS